MYLKISDLNFNNGWREESIIFSESYIKKLQEKAFFRESIVSRAYISQYIGTGYEPQEDENGIPVFQDANFWSISHKTGLGFVGVSDTPIGIDIEYLEEKSPELFTLFPQKMYTVCGGMNWKNFYTLWTSFEAIQKMERWENINLEEFSLLSFESIQTRISEIPFHTRTLYVCKEKTYQVFTGFDENTLYSVCTSQNIDYETIS